MIRQILFPAVAATVLAAPTAWAAGAAERISITDPYVRLLPPGRDETGAYLKLANDDAVDHALVRAASPAARVVELHTVVDEGGVKKMRPVPKMDVKAGGQTELKPGGLHIMLIGLKAPLKESDKVELTLTFEDGSSTQVSAPVKPVQAGMMMKHHQQ
jgi:copper(I)-binding protein